MRRFLLAVPLLIVAAVPRFSLMAQGTVLPSPTTQLSVTSELYGALIGSWVGTLEYRDYSEPATSAKRVKLPTWLSIELAGSDLRFSYVYDDGPAKTVTETSLIRIDPGTNRYTIRDRTGKLEDSYAISGLAELRQGRGVLTLTGNGTDDNAPVAVRTTIRIERNIVTITRETAGAGQPFTFRHTYTLVRAVPPAVAPGGESER